MASPLCFYLDHFLRWKPAVNDRSEGHRAALGVLGSDAAKAILGQVTRSITTGRGREGTFSVMAALDPAVQVFLGAERRPLAVEQFHRAARDNPIVDRAEHQREQPSDDDAPDQSIDPHA